MLERKITDKHKIVAGYSAVEITPPIGEFGSFRLSPTKRSLGVHDNLYASVLYLSNGVSSLLMVSVDTVALPAVVVGEIKCGIAKKTGMSAEHILVAATHTHNGAELLGEEPFIDVTVQINRVVNACAQAAQTAVKNKFSARIGWGYVNVPGVAKNRFQARFGGDTNLVDNRLDFLRVEDGDGNYKGILWHFAAHPTTCMKTGYMSSADYYGVANKKIIDNFGGFSIFFNGACGNINPELGERTFERAEYYGSHIADKLTAIVPQTKTVSYGRLGFTQREVEIPLTAKRKNLISADDCDEIMNYFKNIQTTEIKAIELEYDKYWPAYKRLRQSWWQHKLVEEYGHADSEQVYLQAWRILDHFILTIPGEIFIEFQFELHKPFGDKRAMIFGYANGYCGYIPDATSYELDSYETSPTFSHRAGQHAGDKMLETGKCLIQALI